MKNINKRMPVYLLILFMLSTLLSVESSQGSGAFCNADGKGCREEKQVTASPQMKEKVPGIQATASSQVLTEPSVKPFELPLWGVPVKGPKDAPITLIVFSDFECPFCARSVPIMKELMNAYPDQIRIIFKHSPLPIHPNAPLAHEASLAAWEQGKFWEMHDNIFTDPKKLDVETLIRYAKQLGLEMKRFQSALQNRSHQSMIEQDLTEARALGVTATPTFFINGKKRVGAQSLAALKSVVDEELGLTQQVMRPDRRDEDLSAKKIKIDQAPTKGPKGATVTIVEYSDFQCPFCARVLPALREVMRVYPNQVKWVFKNYPLDFHEDAPLAHQAALAAGEQGKFWEMHDLIFADQNAMKREDLLRAAKQIDLDIKRFVADMESDRLAELIETDKEEGGRLGVDGTPTFFINGKRIVGTRPLSEFKQIIDDVLLKGEELAILH